MDKDRKRKKSDMHISIIIRKDISYYNGEFIVDVSHKYEKMYVWATEHL